MPLYDFRCPVCGKIEERFLPINSDAPVCCEVPMEYGAGSVVSFRIKGLGYNSRRKWMDNWTPESKPFTTGSEHGEKY
jgi:putative FmdB family regulatory protein